jgi:hypothetical protein
MFKIGVVIGVSMRLFLPDAMAAVAKEDFSAIARVNVFRLNPPRPETKPEMVQPELPQVSLVGLATLLGPQALLKIQTKSRPPAAEIACVLSEGQSQDEVKVLRIDANSGTVWLTTRGEPQVLMIGRPVLNR